MAAVQLRETPLGGADRLSVQDAIVRSSAELPRKCERNRCLAKAIGAHRVAIRTAVRETLSLSGPRPAGIHARDPAGTTGPPNPAAFPHASRTRRHRSSRNLEQERKSVCRSGAAGTYLERMD